MAILPKSVSKVIESFERLPGIGPKTAQRLAFYLLHVPQPDLDRFADSVKTLKINTVLCSVCKNVAETDPCSICTGQDRNSAIICVVEQPTDVLSFERTGQFKGLYHVLHGVIDPLNNIGPDEIYLTDLLRRVKNGGVSEIIVATNPNMEGEATAMYIHKEIVRMSPAPTPVPAVTRLAHGLPVGADIEYADEVTLGRALDGRRAY